jgi:predicted ATPase with chaperone activity
MNVVALTDSRLAGLHRQLTNEIARRAKATTNGHDPAAIVHGNELAKRALVVAAAGDHSILFVGPANSGKTMLRAVAWELGLSQTYEARPCSCGHRVTPNVACHCTVRQVERHLRKLPPTDITVEMRCPLDREMRTPGTTLAAMRRQIADKSDYTSTELDEVGRNLLKAAASELALDPDARQRIIAVARTIANLDRSERIEPSHLSEAINYRMLGR